MSIKSIWPMSMYTMNGTFTPLCAQIIPPTRPLILHASLLNFKHILFLPFLPLPLFIFYVFLPSSLSPSSFLSTCLFLVSVISSSSPLCRTVGHILASTHLHINVCLRVSERKGRCVCVRVRESRWLRWISILISTSVNEQSYYRKGGQKGHFTTSPSLSVSSPSLLFNPSIPLSLWRQINHLSNTSWKPNFFFSFASS